MFAACLGRCKVVGDGVSFIGDLTLLNVDSDATS